MKLRSMAKSTTESKESRRSIRLFNKEQFLGCISIDSKNVPSAVELNNNTQISTDSALFTEKMPEMFITSTPFSKSALEREVSADTTLKHQTDSEYSDSRHNNSPCQSSNLEREVSADTTLKHQTDSEYSDSRHNNSPCQSSNLESEIDACVSMFNTKDELILDSSTSENEHDSSQNNEIFHSTRNSLISENLELNMSNLSFEGDITSIKSWTRRELELRYSYEKNARKTEKTKIDNKMSEIKKIIDKK